MRSSEAILFATVLLAAAACSSPAHAQQQAEGFAVERLYTSAPGGGWLVMDALDMRGGLGGAAAFTVGYAHDPLRARSVAVVSDRTFANFGFGATYDRFRLYLNFEMPLAASGDSGTASGYAFTAPDIDPGSHPDTLSDMRIGFDARLLGDADGPFRLGAGAQLFIPNGVRADYVTDDTYRAMGRVLFAGDLGRLTYAGHLGVHVRPLDDHPIPGSPAGSELLFGVAGGPRFPLSADTSIVVGPELFGESALRDFLASATTGVEGLVTGRFEHRPDTGPELRAKLGAGGGLNAKFGAPEWRTVLSIEVVGHPR